jgi:cytochrome c
MLPTISDTVPFATTVRIITCAGVLSIGGATALSKGPPANVPKPDSRNVWSGIYTDAQAKRGEALYEQSCISCHAADLSGASSYDPSPALVGRPFQLSWNSKSVHDLFTLVSVTMPKDRPGALKPNEYADVLAYVFRKNQFPAGPADLPSDADSLRQIQFVLRD